MKQRTSEQRIQDLESKIAGIRARDERRRLRADPVVQQATIAARAITKALKLVDDIDLRHRLELVDAAIREVVTVAPHAPEVEPKRRQRRTAAAT